MSDPRHMHKFWPNRRRGTCQTLVGGSQCGKTEDDIVHQRWVEKHGKHQSYPDLRIQVLDSGKGHPDTAVIPFAEAIKIYTINKNMAVINKYVEDCLAGKYD